LDSIWYFRRRCFYLYASHGWIFLLYTSEYFLLKQRRILLVFKKKPIFCSFYTLVRDGYAVFPKPKKWNEFPSMSIPVTDENVEGYADFLIANAKLRISKYRTNNLLWPWVITSTTPTSSHSPRDATKHILTHLWNSQIWIKSWTISQVIPNTMSGMWNMQPYLNIFLQFIALMRRGQPEEVKILVKLINLFVTFFLFLSEPYANCKGCYWSGFFTSRPGLKGLARKGIRWLIHGFFFLLFAILTRSQLRCCTHSPIILLSVWIPLTSMR